MGDDDDDLNIDHDGDAEESALLACWRPAASSQVWWGFDSFFLFSS